MMEKMGAARNLITIWGCLWPLFLLEGVSGAPVAPQRELEAVSRDLRANPSKTARYLTTYNIPDQWRTVDFALNLVSPAGQLIKTTRISPTIQKFDLRDFVETDDQLVKWVRCWNRLAQSDFYLTPYSNSLLRAYGYPLQRADRFIWFSLSTLGGGGYYEMADIPRTEREWFNQLGVRNNLEVLGSNLYRSQITFKPRRLSRFQMNTGSLYVTRDVLGDFDPVSKPINYNGKFKIEHDASEQISFGRKGLARFVIFDGAGKRIDSVDSAVATDFSNTRDGRLQPGISCIRCHAQSSIQDHGCDTSKLHEVAIPRSHSSYSSLLTKFYDLEKLESRQNYDRARYDRAAKYLGFKDGQSANKAIAKVYDDFVYKAVNLEVASREMGLDVRGVFRSSDNPVLLSVSNNQGVTRNEWKINYVDAVRWCAQSSYLPAQIPSGY